MNEEIARGLAEKYLEEHEMHGLGHCRSALLDAKDPFNPVAGRDLWLMFFERLPTGTDLDHVMPNTIVVAVDCETSTVQQMPLL